MKENPNVGFVGYDMGSTIYDVKHQEIWALRWALIIFYIPILIYRFFKVFKNAYYLNIKNIQNFYWKENL